MVTVVRLPKFGETMKEAVIGEWYKKEGDNVKAGEPLLCVETEKFTVDIEAPSSGVLRKCLASKGSTVTVGSPIAIITEPGEELLDFASIIPSADVESLKIEELRDKVKISPLARKLAKEYGIDISKVTGTGPGGRITKEDIMKVIERFVPPTTTVKLELMKADIVPMTEMRKTIANRLSHSIHTAVHVTITTEVDMYELEKFRRNIISQKEGVHVSITDLIVKAVSEAIKKYPMINSTLEGDNIKIWKNINIGIAVATDKGLIVPVIFNADRKNIVEIAKHSKNLIERARSGVITPNEATGSTFTVSNLGMYGVDIFTPIINPPECAILGIGRIKERPTVINGQIVIRPIAHLSLTFDHRIIDGAVAAQFLNELKRIIEEPLPSFFLKKMDMHDTAEG